MTEALTTLPSPQDVRARTVRERIEAELKEQAFAKVYKVHWLGTGFSVHPEHGYVSDTSTERAAQRIKRFLVEQGKALPDD